jgi:hypothetical protein
LREVRQAALRRQIENSQRACHAKPFSLSRVHSFAIIHQQQVGMKWLEVREAPLSQGEGASLKGIDADEKAGIQLAASLRLGGTSVQFTEVPPSPTIFPRSLRKRT